MILWRRFPGQTLRRVILPRALRAALAPTFGSGSGAHVPESFPPFSALGAEGEHEGHDVDVAKLVAEDPGVELELVPVVSKQRIPFLESDRVDLAGMKVGPLPPLPTFRDAPDRPPPLVPFARSSRISGVTG